MNYEDSNIELERSYRNRPGIRKPLGHDPGCRPLRRNHDTHANARNQTQPPRTAVAPSKAQISKLKCKLQNNQWIIQVLACVTAQRLLLFQSENQKNSSEDPSKIAVASAAFVIKILLENYKVR